MSTQRSLSRRASDLVIHGAAPLVPADIRGDWRREWNAELAYRARRDSGVSLVLRSLGAFAHAIWLRWDRWRLEMLLQDLRYALRTLVRKPGFAVITLLTLAVGIGANATIFSVVRAVLLRPLPYPEPQQLMQISATSVRNPHALGGAASPPEFVDWRRQNRTFVEMAAVNPGSYALTGHGAAEQVPGANVTGGFFRVFAVPALYGRTLQLEDDHPGTENAVVIGHGLWTRRFGADPAVIGRTIRLEGQAYRVVGVMPRDFAYPLQSEVWLPQRFTERDLTTQRGAHYLDVVGRLRADATIARAREDMSAIAHRLSAAYPDTDRDSRIAVHGLRDALVGDVRPALLMLLGAVGFVLLIVCVNLANLVLTRALGRTREMVIRTALGAGRFRLVRGVLIESLVLAGAGGAAGLALALWLTGGIAALQQALGIPLLDQTRVDTTVVVFTAAVSIAAALVFGTFPAWQAAASGQLAERIREESANATGNRRRQRIRGGMIVAETALAVVLLIGAGLLLRSFARLTSVELGFDPRGVQTFNISLPDAKYPTPAQRAAFVRSFTDAMRRQTGVEAVGGIFGMPLTNFRYVISMSTLDGRTLDNDEQNQRSVQVRVVTPEYFQSVGIPILEGRSVGPADDAGAPPVVVVNETAARNLWPGVSALGRHFTIGTQLGQGGGRAGGTVIGVARDVRDYGPSVPVRPTIYLAHAQFPVGFLTMTVRTTRATVSFDTLRATLAGLDPELPMFRVRTLEQLAADAVVRPRVYLLLLSLFAAVAVLLAAIGIYGVLTHAVAQRTREIGIRLALGARRREVTAMVVRQAAGLAAAGLAAGLVLAVAAAGSLRTLLFGVEPTDLPTYVLVGAALMAVALVASFVPARRAARVDPVSALRYDQ